MVSHRPQRPASTKNAEAGELWKVWLDGAKESPDAWFALDDEGRVLSLTRPVRGIVRGECLWETVTEAEQAGVKAAIQNAFHPGISQDLVAGIQESSSVGMHYHRLQLFPLRESGKVSVVVGSLADIDETRRELDRLRDSEAILRDSQGMTHIGIWYWDVSEPHAHWTDELYEIYGLDQATHVPTYQDYLTRVHPDDVERVKAATEAVFNDFKPYSHDERIRHSDGGWRHLHTWAKPILDAQGKLKALMGVCQDVTAWRLAEDAVRRSEDRHRAIVEEAPMGIATVQAGKVRETNSAFRRLLGTQDGEPLDAVLAPDAAAELAELLEAAAEPGAFATIATGEHRWVEFRARQVGESTDAFVVLLARDVSIEREAEEARNRIRELEELGEHQNRMFGVAAHEIKNPLTPVLTQIYLLERGHLGPLSDAQERAIQSLGTQLRHMTNLTHDLLDSTRAATGALEIVPAPCDLADLAATVEAHRAEAERAGVDLKIEARPTKGEFDLLRLTQVLRNLVTNAIRHSPGGMVMVRIQPDPPIIEVADTGEGMDAKTLASIFEPFESGGQGAGLGLYFSKAIVEAHGGTISVSSKPGKGTVFRVGLQ